MTGTFFPFLYKDEKCGPHCKSSCECFRRTKRAQSDDRGENSATCIRRRDDADGRRSCQDGFNLEREQITIQPPVDASRSQRSLLAVYILPKTDFEQFQVLQLATDYSPKIQKTQIKLPV